jgi:FKBP-type peptidyl-prolyl cis-trans isomerase
MPAVTDYGYEARDKLGATKLPIAQVWAPGKLNDQVTELAEKYRGRLIFVRMSQSESYMMEDFGFGGKDISVAFGLGIVNSFNWEDKDRFGYGGDELDANARQFIEDFLAGKLSPSLKSQVVPKEPPQKGVVNVGVAANIQELAAGSQLVLLLYKTYNEGWKEVADVLTTVAKITPDVQSMLFAKMDTSNNGIDPKLFPEVDDNHEASVFLYDSSQPHRPARQIEMVDQTTKQPARVLRRNLANYLKDQVPEMAEKWASIEAELEKLDAEELAAEEAKRKAEEEKYANARKVDVTDGIIKYVFTEPAEDASGPPQAGDMVTAHYTGTLEDGTKFDSSVDRGDPFKFTLGQGQVIKCWDQGFATMKQGEKAQLKCNAANAYGERGSPPTIPGGATLLFDVELISFESSGKKEL